MRRSRVQNDLVRLALGEEHDILLAEHGADAELWQGADALGHGLRNRQQLDVLLARLRLDSFHECIIQGGIRSFEITLQKRRRKIERGIDVIKAAGDAVLGERVDVNFRTQEIAKGVGILDAVEPAKACPAIARRPGRLLGREPGGQPAENGFRFFRRRTRLVLWRHGAVVHAIEDTLPRQTVLGEIRREVREVQFTFGLVAAVAREAISLQKRRNRFECRRSSTRTGGRGE